MSIANELLLLNDTKLAIKEAIINKGVEVGEEDTFASYADKIEEIEGGTKIDISKVNYQLGASLTAYYNGRILHGFANMPDYCAFPVEPFNTSAWIDIDWTKDYEIGIGFNFSSLSNEQAFFGTGRSDANKWRKCPRLFYVPSKQKLELDLSYDGSTLAAIDIDFKPNINTWYFLKFQFIKSTMNLIISVTTDFNNYNIIYNDTLPNTQYHDSSSIAFGGERASSGSTTNNFAIDTFNTYLKDDTGEIVWGTYAGAFDDGKYPIISKDYALVEYIESDGTQYIDTSRKVNAGDTFNILYSVILAPSGQAWSTIWGAYDGNNTTRLVLVSSNLKDRYDSGTFIDRTSYATNNIYSDSFIVNNTLNGDVYVFSGTNDITWGTASIRLYQFSISGDYFLPCKRKSDGVFGLYDVANQTFLTDMAGGNPLTGGQVICVFNEATSPNKEI